jgi:hypothetical protein
MPWPIAAINSYRLGGLAALAVLGVVCGWLVLRALDVLPGAGRAAARPASAWMAAAPATRAPATDSVSYDDLRIAPPRRFNGRLLAAAIVVGALAVGGYIRFGSHDSGVWSSGRGLALKTGFMDNCRMSGLKVDCECAFDHITATPPYNTPVGLARLGGATRTFEQTGDPSRLPSVFVSGLTGCFHVGS